jgi:hypothetical protein
LRMAWAASPGTVPIRTAHSVVSSVRRVIFSSKFKVQSSKLKVES